jgi:two-component system, OmpR family, phosphate regulon sensor histidine kinase PhoR
MFIGVTAIAGTALLTGGAVWTWRRWIEGRRLARLRRALDLLVQEGPPDAALAVVRVDPALDSMRPNFQRLVRHQELMLQRIEREESSMRMVLSSMEEGVLVVDARFRIRLANAAFISGFGLTKSPMDRSVLEVLGEPDVHRLIQEALEKGEARERQLEMIPGKRVRYISVRAVPMSDENGLPGVLAVFRDVTRLQELEQVRREFVANVSHELRTPLAIFQGYVESLIDMPDLPQAERSEVYQVLMKHSGRLNGLVEELLSLARMEARTEQFSWETLAPEAMIREVVTEWQMRAGGNAVETHVEVASELPEVRVDRVRIEQVLHNLLENALKHVPAKGGRIVIRAVYETGEGVRVVVEDNGSGIAHKDLPHIFERFYRADKSRGAAGMRGMGRSTGLGLSIVKHIIAAHGGEVGAESPHGSGARVWFRLPVAPGEQ